MTAPETVAITVPAEQPGLAQPFWKKWTLFGNGLGVAITGRHLEVAVVRMRPSGTSLLAATTILDFETRPAAEWGAEISRFLAAAKESRLAATIVLPREEVIVRPVPLPGVAEKDVTGALELQIDTLHPWAGDEVAWSWTRVSASAVLVGIVRRAVLTAWETLFSEAGVEVAAITFSAAAIYSALRLREAPPASILFYIDSRSRDGSGARLEVYGESPARPVYSAEFNTIPERALSIARAELRMPAETTASSLRDALHAQPDAGTLAWTASLVSAVPFGARLANFIPASRRASHSRIQYAIPMALVALLILAAIGVFAVLPAIERRRTVAALAAEVRQLEPQANRAQSLERAIATARSRTAALADFRSRTPSDLDVLEELSRILPSNAWTSQVEVLPETVTIAGEAAEAGPLLRLLDSSPLFQNSEFSVSVVRTAQQMEQFRIRTQRRGRSGRATP
jgi:Tfp pilus assembly protein PilN